MGRAANPRRPGKGAAIAFFMGALVAAGFALPAFATGGGDDAQTERAERNKGASTVLGAPAAGECAQAAADGRIDDAAIMVCDRAIATERLNRANRIATLVNRGAINLRRRSGDAALADFDAVVAMDPKNAEAHLNRGAALIMVSRPGPAVAAITTALSLGVRYPYKAYFNRGAAREALGDARGAYEDYNTALTIQPDWGPAEAELARFVRGRRERLAAQLADRPLPNGQQ